MFALKSRTEPVISVLLIAAILFNALIPSAAVAMSLTNEPVDSSSLLAAHSKGIKRSAFKISASSQASQTALQDATPSATATNIDVPTPAASETLTSEVTPIPSETLVPPATLEPLATSTLAITASPLGTQTVVAGQAPVLSFKFSVAPEQAAPGDEVIFTIEVVNTGNTPATGLAFSNILPQEFGTGQSGLRDFNFDPRTRLLTWSGAQAGVTTLAPGQIVTLAYSVKIDAQLDEVQLIDSAIFAAVGLPEPLLAEAVLTVLSPQKRMTMLGPDGGKAVGLDGRIEVSLPGNAVDVPRGLLIQDLNEGMPPETDQPWLKFALEMRVPRPGNAQPITFASATDTTSQAAEALASTGEIISVLEKDRIIPLEPVEAQFDQPVEIAVSFDGLTDLATMGADITPFLTTLDEASGTWVRVPLKTIDREANRITAEVTHFSIWGVGFGPSFPQDGAGMLLFDDAYPELFTGSARYSIPIWTPPGRNGMQPDLALSYSSNTANGVLGDVQAPWVGMGWSLESASIARKITNGQCTPCAGGGSYGYENKFILLLNGTGYELVPNPNTPDRYHTEAESFMYIQRHNDLLGSPSASNATGEWWEVMEKDGTRWRLGYNNNSEQRAAMSGYPGSGWTSTYTGWGALGYAGNEPNVVATRWRVDQVTDVYGNYMTFEYEETPRTIGGLTYDQASYIKTIAYTEHTSGTPTAGYSVNFVLVDRGGQDVPGTPTAWDNWDTKLLDRIDVKYGPSTVVRTYDLGYTVRPYMDGVSWQTTTLTSLAISGGGTNMPTMSFGYIDKINRAVYSSWNEWPYPRLETITNGWGGVSTYVYGNDGRDHTTWYNWRVQEFRVTDSVSTGPMKSTFEYSQPCYTNPASTIDGWCTATSPGSLVGHGQVTAKAWNLAGSAIREQTVHKYLFGEVWEGLEHETLFQDGLGTTLRKIFTQYESTWASGYPSDDSYFTTPAFIDEFVQNGGSLVQISRTRYGYDAYTGNLLVVKENDASDNTYRQTDYEYVTNISPSVWILNTLSRRTVKNSSLAVVSKQEYGYDGQLPIVGNSTLLTDGRLTLSRVVNGSQTIDTAYHYDAHDLPYGNVTETRHYKNYGSTGSAPSGAYLTYANDYETGLETYVISSDPPLIAATTTQYDPASGLPIQVTDPNGNTTYTTYDGLGRVKTVRYPGYGVGQENVKYTYPTPSGSPLSVSAPFKITMEVRDDTISNYRTAYQFMDGLGRVVQTQSPYQGTSYTLTDVMWDAVGLLGLNGLPRTATGGTYSPAPWTGGTYSTTNYDALRRTTRITYPDGAQDNFTYSGLETTIIDRNNHKKVQVNDEWGRLEQVKEYTGSGTYTLYATTNYEYDERDLLDKVIDAAGNQTSIGYDGYGRKIEMTDPDLGNWRYRYNARGNLTAQIDARRQAINVYYDDLNRLIGKTYNAGPVNPDTYQPPADPGYTGYTVKNYFDVGTNGIGYRTSMVDPSGTTTWVYNGLGQVTNETHNIESTNYSISGTFDAFGRPITQTIPSNGSTETLNYTYNDMGALASLTGTNTYVSQINYAPSGKVNDQLLGNGLRQQSCYETNTLRLSKIRVYPGVSVICANTPSNPLLNLSYTYQNNGNVSQMADLTHSETLTYTYDELDRLDTVSGPYSQNYDFNSIGNTQNKTLTFLLTAVTADRSHTCALTTGGGVKCWGNNTQGRLGDGTSIDRSTPVDVSNLTFGVSAISGGSAHTCALTIVGGVKCWGKNANGQLGDGSTTQRNTPVNVSGLTSGVSAISGGGEHTCALTTGGGVKCWGDNLYGQLGDGTNTDRNAPVNVSGLTSGVSAIAVGENHTCAVTTSGGLKCWGKNDYGQLGNSTTTNSNLPVNVNGLASGVSTASLGEFHTCALLTTGGLKCWGRNTQGQLGDSTTTQRNTPVDVSGLTSGVSAVSSGDDHTCALTTGGAAKCWGDNIDGQLGDGTNIDRLIPVNVSGLTSGVSAIASGGKHACARTTVSVVKCWGRNEYGQLGNGTLVNTNAPVDPLFTSSATYTYGDAAHKHAVTSLSTGETYTYDANGNMITRVEGGLTYTQTFDAENRLISVAVSGQTTQFIYDGDGNLVKKIKPDGSKTIYVGGIYEVDKASGGSIQRTVTYYPAAGAMRINSTLYYTLKDHLGSASVVTNASGTILGENRYYPYGETRLTTGTIFTDKLFTGQREMAGLGIYHYGARFYSPNLGRFLSPDTIVPGAANPQNLNRFSYVLNNPLRYIDPTGHLVTDGGGGGSTCNIFTSGCNTSGGSGGCNTLASCLGGGGGSGGGNSGGCNTLSSCGGGGGHPLPSPAPNRNPPLYGDADLYSFSYGGGVGPWFGTVSIDIVINEEEAGAFLSYGVGPGFGGDQFPGFNNLNDFDWTFFTPQAGSIAWRGVMSGTAIRDDIRAYQGPAFQAGGSAGAPLSGALEYFSSVDLETGMVDRQIEGLAVGIGSGPPAELHFNYVNAIYLPEFSGLVNLVCQAIGCGRLE